MAADRDTGYGPRTELAPGTASAPDIGKAVVWWNGTWFLVIHKGVEYARFAPDQFLNATDFANGFNVGMVARG